MSTHITLSRRHVKAYHHHHHLLVQFIWFELMLAQQHIKEAVNVLENLKGNHRSTTHNSLIYLLKTHITKLSGSAHDYMRLFAWGDDGILAKLKNYCALFSQNKIGLGREQFDISREANKAWLLSLEALDIIRVISDQPSKASKEPISLIIKKIKLTITRLKKLMIKIACHFRNDENVLLFILRHHEGLDQLHRRGFVKILLSEMYPKNINEAQKFLIKKYTARGFTELVPFIRSTFEKFR